MKRFVALAAVVFLGVGSVASASPGHGHLDRADLGRGASPEGGTINFHAGRETVVYTFSLEPGATSGWHRHPGAVMVLVKSGSLTTYGLSRPPCTGEDINPGGAYFEKDASTARWPHFVRNRGSVPMEAVVVAFDVPRGESVRTEADAPTDCPDPN